MGKKWLESGGGVDGSAGGIYARWTGGKPASSEEKP